MNKTIQTIEITLKERYVSAGGFEENPGGGYRPDATAWSVIALRAVDSTSKFIAPACFSLAQNQLEDGRVPLSPKHPQACWPTPLAILAWLNDRQCGEARELAISFLLNFTGVHWEKPTDTPLAHDTALQGWPWIADTHSWVEPTALSVIALRSAGHVGHSRVAEAVEMLMDRQLPDGGWNYGNTKVYNQTLSPMPDSTGLALSALAGLVPEKEVIRSIDYLSEILPEIKSPFSLSWGLLGLRAWEHQLKDAGDLVYRCLNRRSLCGNFTTIHLCLLLLAHPDIAESSLFSMQGVYIDP